ncbi:unnamed protein product [Spirodela intermedia]|uniref:GDP-fucose protein O-fucosyltransferase 2 n=1 Tax=Spirodela intermedia TaxID=51605 RepID=A0A7I8IXZ7_SPIIN|nr:unnamed protein product [Spirodela intermedia]CAA6662728.1 unnamed protein product [Spirodela intermedia]
MERASSSDEDDGETLIAQNERKRQPLRSDILSFEIGEPPDRKGCGFRSSRKYVFAVCLCLLLVVVIYFSVDTRRLFHGASAVGVGSPVEDDRMREAELRALNLLRHQQVGLLRLWNRTSAASPVRSSGSPASSVPIVASNSTSNSTPSAAQEFRSGLLEQIKLNQQIQKALLSSHGLLAVNTSAEVADGNVGDLLAGYVGADLCRKVDKPRGRRTVEWHPKKNRYLLAICVSGQMSNHLICLQKHMFFAAILDRILILPSPKFDYQYDRVIDIDHINQCFDRKVVISFEEFSESKKNKIQINRFICYMASPPCFLEAAWPEDAKLTQPKKRVVGDITGKFSCNDEVLAVGDIFYADVEEEWVMQPGGPLTHQCETLIQPSHLVLLTAQRFVQTFLGNNYIAVHFRRHGFLQFCNAKEESCFFPVPQAAECILRVVEKTNAPVIYLSTDAAASETDLLQSLVASNNRPIPMIKRPAHSSIEKWDALLYRNHLGEDSQVEAILDKTICAMASVFIGSSGSTFTDDIFRLRKDWGFASVCDENLCSGEQPNFIASKE